MRRKGISLSLFLVVIVTSGMTVIFVALLLWHCSSFFLSFFLYLSLSLSLGNSKIEDRIEIKHSNR